MARRSELYQRIIIGLREGDDFLPGESAHYWPPGVGMDVRATSTSIRQVLPFPLGLYEIQKAKESDIETQILITIGDVGCSILGNSSSWGRVDRHRTRAKRSGPTTKEVHCGGV